MEQNKAIILMANIFILFLMQYFPLLKHIEEQCRLGFKRSPRPHQKTVEVKLFDGLKHNYVCSILLKHFALSCL